MVGGERFEGQMMNLRFQEELERNPRRPQKPSDSPFDGVFSFIALVALGAYWYFRPPLGAILSALMGWIIGHTSLLLFQILFVVLILAFAISLYLLRRKWRRLYATLEIAFGVSASIFAANGITASPDHDSQFRNLVAALGGIYIIIRGLDNWFQKPPQAV